MPRQRKGKRGSIINKWGVKITKKEQEEINRLKKQIDKVRKTLQEQLDKDQEKRQSLVGSTSSIDGKKKGKKVKNKFQEDFENFHLEEPILPNRRTSNKNQFKNRGLLEAWLKTARQIVKNPQKYLDQKMETFQQNYLESILNNYSNGGLLSNEKAYGELPKNVKELYDKVLSMTPQEFYQAYLDGSIPTINENYIPSDEYPRYIEDTYGYFEDHEEVQMKFDEEGNFIPT